MKPISITSLAFLFLLLPIMALHGDEKKGAELTDSQFISKKKQEMMAMGPNQWKKIGNEARTNKDWRVRTAAVQVLGMYVPYQKKLLPTVLSTLVEDSQKRVWQEAAQVLARHPKVIEDQFEDLLKRCVKEKKVPRILSVLAYMNRSHSQKHLPNLVPLLKHRSVRKVINKFFLRQGPSVLPILLNHYEKNPKLKGIRNQAFVFAEKFGPRAAPHLNQIWKHRPQGRSWSTGDMEQFLKTMSRVAPRDHRGLKLALGCRLGDVRPRRYRRNNLYVVGRKSLILGGEEAALVTMKSLRRERKDKTTKLKLYRFQQYMKVFRAIGGEAKKVIPDLLALYGNLRHNQWKKEVLEVLVHRFSGHSQVVPLLLDYAKKVDRIRGSRTVEYLVFKKLGARGVAPLVKLFRKLNKTRAYYSHRDRLTARYTGDLLLENLEHSVSSLTAILKEEKNRHLQTCVRMLLRRVSRSQLVDLARKYEKTKDSSIRQTLIELAPFVGRKVEVLAPLLLEDLLADKKVASNDKRLQALRQGGISILTRVKKAYDGHSGPERSRLLALMAHLKKDDPSVHAKIAGAMQSTHEEVRKEAVRAACTIPQDMRLEAVALLKHSRSEVRMAALEVLDSWGRMFDRHLARGTNKDVVRKAKSAGEKMVAQLEKEKEPSIRAKILAVLAHRKFPLPKKLGKIAVKFLGDKEVSVRVQAVYLLRRFPSPAEAQIPQLIQFLTGGNRPMKMAVLDTLRSLGKKSRPALSAIKKATGDKDLSVRNKAQKLLHILIWKVSQVKVMAKAAQKGLDYLAQKQGKSGLWTEGIGYKLNNTYLAYNRAENLGVSALVGLAFLSGGHWPGRGKHGAVVEKLVDFYLKEFSQRDKHPLGYLNYKFTRMYSHGFSLLFLARIYQIRKKTNLTSTEIKTLGEIIERAVDLTEKSQAQFTLSKKLRLTYLPPQKVPTQILGGWQYTPHPSLVDTTSTVCQLQALFAAAKAGFSVDSKVVERGFRYLLSCQVQVPRSSQRRFQLNKGAFVYAHKRGSYNNYPRSGFACTTGAMATICDLTSTGSPFPNLAGLITSAERKEVLARGVGSLKDRMLRETRFIRKYKEANLQGVYPKQIQSLVFDIYFLYGLYYTSQIAGEKEFLSKGQQWWDEIVIMMVATQDKRGRWTGVVGENYCTAVSAMILLDEVSRQKAKTKPAGPGKKGEESKGAGGEKTPEKKETGKEKSSRKTGGESSSSEK